MSTEWYQQQEAYYNIYFAQTFNIPVSAFKVLCRKYNYNLTDHLVPSLDPQIQLIYLGQTLTETLDTRTSAIHHASKSVYIAFLVIIIVLTAAFLLCWKSPYIKNNAPKLTSLTLFSSIIIVASFGPMMFVDNMSCNTSLVFLNYSIGAWFIAQSCKLIFLMVKYKLSAIHFKPDDASILSFKTSDKIFNLLGRWGFANEKYLFKFGGLLTLIGFIPGFIFAAHPQNFHSTELGICNYTTARYTYIFIMIILFSLILIASMVFINHFRNDTFYVRYQILAYGLIIDPLLLYSFAFLADKTIFFESIHGAWNALYIVPISALVHTLIAAGVPLLFTGINFARILLAKGKDTPGAQFSAFAIAFCTPSGWKNIYENSISNFCEENSLFIQRYGKLLKTMRKNGRVFTSTKGEPSFIFRDDNLSRLGKVAKLTNNFEPRVWCLLSYEIPEEECLVYDIEPNEDELRILKDIHRDFLLSNSPFELNIPEPLEKSVRSKIQREEFSCLMYEGIKNEVIKMVYENTFKNMQSQSPDSSTQFFGTSMLSIKTLNNGSKSLKDLEAHDIEQ